MKSYLPLIASLTLISAPLIPEPLVAEETQLVASEIDPELKAYARSISVKIFSNNNRASGVLIGQQGNQYLALTNKHVIQQGKNLTIQTDDGIEHQATVVDNPITSDDDIALLTFSSKNSYQLVQLNSADTSKEEKRIYAAGYVAETEEFTLKPGTIEHIPHQPFQEGYRIGYTSNVVSGMSGGAIFDEFGDLVGINSTSAFPILNTAYEYQDGTTPTSTEIEQFRSLSWGLSVHSLLTQLNPEIITAYGLPLPETVADVGKTELTGWLADLETKAKQISVRIDSSSSANGSGVIIAREDNTYTVLTADHVLCEPDQDRNCLDYTYEIVTPDGQKYPVDLDTIRRQPGVDLAVVEFSSEETYQVAQLADYPVTDDDAIFVAGYPKLNSGTVSPWRFSLGYGLELEQGLLNVNSNGNSSVESSSLSSLSSLGSLSGGYEMVYTSVTYGGMSGGAVLDRDGRVIGIHGLAEEETAFDNQSGDSSKIQLGYSLGIPVNTFVGLTDKLDIEPTQLIQNNSLSKLTSTEKEDVSTAILTTKIDQGNTTASMYIERGNQLWRLKRYDEAITVLEKAIALSPDFVYLAYYAKGLALYRLRKYQAALDSFERATASNSNFAPAFSWKSLSLQELNRWHQALIAIEKAIALQEDNPVYHNTKGNVLSNLKRYSAAIAAFNQAIAISPRSSFYLSRALVYLNSEQPDLALADYNQAIELNPQSSKVYLYRSGFYDEQGQPELALADLNLSIQLNPNYADGYNSRGLFYQKRQQYSLALADFNRATKLEPNHYYAYNNLGLLYHEQQKPNLALTSFNQVIEIDPNEATAYNNRGLVHSSQNKPELALAEYNQAIKLDPYYSVAYSNRGSIYYKLQKLDSALADYNRAIKIDPNNSRAYTNRGNFYSGQNQPDLALADHNQAIKLAPQFAGAYVNRGNVYADLNQINLAFADYNRAIKLNSDHFTTATAYFNRGNLYKSQGKMNLAIADLNQAIQLNPHDAEFYTVRGDLHQFQKSPALALADYNQAIKVNPEYAGGYTGRGKVYADQGKPRLAQADLNQAVKLDPQSGDAYVYLGFLHAGNRNIEAAISSFEQAQQIFINQENSEQEKIVSQALEFLKQQ